MWSSSAWRSRGAAEPQAVKIARPVRPGTSGKTAALDVVCCDASRAPPCPLGPVGALGV